MYNFKTNSHRHLTVGVWRRLFGGAPSSMFSEVGCRRFLLGEGDELTLLTRSLGLSALSPLTRDCDGTELLFSSPLERCGCINLGLPCTVAIVSLTKSLCYARLPVSIAAFTQDNSQHSPADIDL